MSQCKEDEGASKLPNPWSQAAKLGFWLQAGRCSTLWLQMVAQHREEPAQSRMAVLYHFFTLSLPNSLPNSGITWGHLAGSSLFCPSVCVSLGTDCCPGLF